MVGGEFQERRFHITQFYTALMDPKMNKVEARRIELRNCYRCCAMTIQLL